MNESATNYWQKPQLTYANLLAYLLVDDDID